MAKRGPKPKVKVTPVVVEPKKAVVALVIEDPPIPPPHPKAPVQTWLEWFKQLWS